MTLVDIQLLYGDTEFTSAYFESNKEKKESIVNFLEFLNYPDRKESFKRLGEFIGNP